MFYWCAFAEILRILEIKNLGTQCGRRSFLVYTQLQLMLQQCERVLTLNRINPTSKKWIFFRFIVNVCPNFFHKTTREQAKSGDYNYNCSLQEIRPQFFPFPFIISLFIHTAHVVKPVLFFLHLTSHSNNLQSD